MGFYCGKLNSHVVGIVMKEMVRRVIEEIRSQRFVFEASAKEGHDGEMDDVVTTADKAAQEIYVKLIREGFPTCGIVAEEDDLRIECTDRIVGNIYFTVDPLDGTKAYKRRQSHGIGTMISLVHDHEILAAYVGDVMTREIYGYRPESNKVHRISECGHGETLQIEPGKLLDERVLIRQRPEEYSLLTQRLLAPHFRGGLCNDLEITGGSIGISMARLWKGEVSLAVIGSNYETPWDSTPIHGISAKLGCIFLEPDDNGKSYNEVTPPIYEKVTPRSKELLIVHASRWPEIQAWQARA